MPIIQREVQNSISVAKGNMPALSSHQRRLIEIFVWYLRQLPKYRDAEGHRGSSWESNDYDILNRLLLRFFQAKHPNWLPRPETKRYNIWDLPEFDAEEYDRLMKNASTADDPRSKRRLDLLELAREKQRLFRFIEDYQCGRKELGLPSDPAFSGGAPGNVNALA